MRAIIMMVAVLAAPAASAQGVDYSGSYLCTMTNAVGFKPDDKAKKWGGQEYEVDREQTLVKVSRKANPSPIGRSWYDVTLKQIGFEQGFTPCSLGGGTISGEVGVGVIELRGRLECRTVTQYIAVNLMTLRFQSYSAGTYTMPEGTFGPVTTIGTCEKID